MSDADTPTEGVPASEGEDTGSPVDPDLAVDQAAEVVEQDLASLLKERDDYLDGLRRVQAEFENYRKRVMKQQADHEARATESLVANLLPVLDACDAAAAQGVDGAQPIAAALHDTLAKEGLVVMDAAEAAFDPERHEAVQHEPGDGSDAGPTVAEVLRLGYEWKGRVLRPAMVKVRG
jgi:molecular chaperone GrpE